MQQHSVVGGHWRELSLLASEEEDEERTGRRGGERTEERGRRQEVGEDGKRVGEDRERGAWRRGQGEEDGGQVQGTKSIIQRGTTGQLGTVVLCKTVQHSLESNLISSPQAERDITQNYA